MEIIPLAEDRIEAAGEMLGRAFWDDPFSIFVLPDEADRTRGITALYTFAVRYGHLFGEVATTPALDGAAIWLPPGSGPMTEEWEVAAGGMELAFDLGAAMERLDTITSEFGRLHRRDAAEPHWYLMTLGVEPA